ncbi:hypothetical protein ABZ401_23745 [Streptomyces sp. NPDC005892]|uniref:hypothetical protein n=1 Tax=Streptomyces sp. NPDC005892 TaxID=3155593 RepID=UPI0034104C1B
MVMLAPPGPPDPPTSIDEAAMARTPAATETRVRRGKVSGVVGATVIPFAARALVSVASTGSWYVNAMR